jgi:BlaI family penicillinase repressor
MSRPTSKHPTELELQILKILWRDGTSSVQHVRGALAADQGRDLARTSVVTTLNIMTEKELVAREQRGKANFFTAFVEHADVSQGMLADLLNRVFDGSAEALVLNLLESEEVDADEHQALRRLINRKRGGK